MKAGDEFGPTRWVEVDQDRVDAFAGATEDSQWIHTNRQRAAEGPFGTTIAHGFLTLSLLPALWFEVAGDGDHPLTINYGVNRVRFPAPVPVGSRIRAHVELVSVDDVPGGVQVKLTSTVELEEADKPACVSETIFRWLT